MNLAGLPKKIAFRIGGSIYSFFGISRNKLIKRLKEDGIDTRPVFPTISKYPMWESDCHNPNAVLISENSINLPSGHNLKEHEIDYISKRIQKHLKN